MKLKHLFAIFIAALVLFNLACTPYKNIPYFQDLRRDSITTEDITNYSPVTIQPGDQLGLHFTSLNVEASALFNYNLERPSGGSGNLDRSEQNAVVGYYVDTDGNIVLPLVGKVKATGFTTTEFAKVVEEKVLPYLTKPTVSVRYQNFKVSVLGDVRSPNLFNIYNERTTVSEVLSMAGDLNITGIRRVVLIRELEGKRQYIPLDLTSKNIFSSPYYYVKKNDVIYVQPNEQRAANDGSTFQRASLVISVLSVVAVLLTR
ncbi:polysaccharide biosynthesis/export family protein [Mucilaginibacter psychrotolerans]|uniref:Polysaccharide export protein n=1 Tax=Mucilaginibacter psychrotolerans TaxID=1524096 RepID=A0A4Y8SJY2_9SPHI|nr:polysaccharide biosynthesis/export family protein [Mucilaginibacter psychrotolerans]TFF38784.1 polysaccharide export protein [Mucilaginibacter psychrotolerans]